MSKINVLRDKMVEKASKDLELAMRNLIASRLNELVEQAIRKAMEDTEITLDGATLEIDVKFKE